MYDRSMGFVSANKNPISFNKYKPLYVKRQGTNLWSILMCFGSCFGVSTAVLCIVIQLLSNLNEYDRFFE